MEGEDNQHLIEAIPMEKMCLVCFLSCNTYQVNCMGVVRVEMKVVGRGQKEQGALRGLLEEGVEEVVVAGAAEAVAL